MNIVPAVSRRPCTTVHAHRTGTHSWWGPEDRRLGAAGKHQPAEVPVYHKLHVFLFTSMLLSHDLLVFMEFQ